MTIVRQMSDKINMKQRQYPRLCARIDEKNLAALAKIKKDLDVDWNRLMEVLIDSFYDNKKQ